MRQALASQLAISDIVPVLSTMTKWILYWNAVNEELSTASPPSLNSIVIFLQNLLDAHFIGILQDNACHAAVIDLTMHLAEATSITSDLGKLSGPLTSIRREHDKITRPRSNAETAKQEALYRESLGEYTVDLFEI